MRDIIANLCLLLALAGISTAAFLVAVPLGVLVGSVAIGVVGYAIAPERDK